MCVTQEREREEKDRFNRLVKLAPFWELFKAKQGKEELTMFFPLFYPSFLSLCQERDADFSCSHGSPCHLVSLIIS